MLPPHNEVEFHVKLKIYEDGVEYSEEEKIVICTTGDGINYIPEYNIAASYPYNGQYNFYKEEKSDQIGYIHLQQGQHYLFYDNSYTILAKVSTPAGLVISTEIDYDLFNNEIQFPLPANSLNNDEIYKLELVKDFGGSGNDRNNDGVSSDVLTELYFRTSEYNSFIQKIDSWTSSMSYDGSNNRIRKFNAQDFEPFTKDEVYFL